MWRDIFKFIVNLFCAPAETQVTQPQGHQAPYQQSPSQGQQHFPLDQWQHRPLQKHQVYISIASPFYQISSSIVILGCEPD